MSASFVASLGSGPYVTPIGGPLAGNPFGRAPLWVDGVNGSDGNGGTSKSDAFKTIQKAINAAVKRDTIIIADGSYNETVTITRKDAQNNALNNLTLIGAGGRGAVAIAPTAANSNGLVNDSDDLTLRNVGLAAVGTGSAFINTGDRFRAYESKLENDDGTGLAAQMTLGTIAQVTAGTKGKGADCLFDDCEFAWAGDGLKVLGTDRGALTELAVRRCRFHNIVGKDILEGVGSGGSAPVTYASLEISDSLFDRNEAGAEPTGYIVLNASNANTGIVTRCSFPTALAGGKNLVSTLLLWVSNYHTGGVSNGQPS